MTRHLSPLTFYLTPHHGFTLIELLVTVTIFSGILGALLISFLVGRKSFLSADAYIEVQQESRRGMDAMTSELREAGWRGAPGPTPPASGVPQSELIFQLALGYDQTGTAGCPASSVCWGAQDASGTAVYDYRVRYRISGTQLIREVLDTGNNPVAGTNRVLANNVAGPPQPFTYNSADRVMTVQLQVQKNSAQLASGATGMAALNARVKLRNN